MEKHRENLCFFCLRRIFFLIVVTFNMLENVTYSAIYCLVSELQRYYNKLVGFIVRKRRLRSCFMFFR